MPTVAASATSFVREQLARGDGAIAMLGAFPTALYFELPSGSVVAVQTSDAIVLPLGLVVPATSAIDPLRCRRGPARIEDDALVLGTLRIAPAVDRPSKIAFVGAPLAARIDEARRILAGASDLDAAFAARSAASLIGRGPGLTPAGDDYLCGMLAGGFAFGRSHEALRAAILGILADRPRATTSLSRQLLRLACERHAIEQVIHFAQALCSRDPDAIEPAATRLSTIGHSSGTALARGVLAAASLLG